MVVWAIYRGSERGTDGKLGRRSGESLKTEGNNSRIRVCYIILYVRRSGRLEGYGREQISVFSVENDGKRGDDSANVELIESCIESIVKITLI